MSEGHRERAEGRLGQVVSGKWRLERLLGVGGFAAVYAATHVDIGRRVAIKLLHPAVALSRANTARLVLEARAANAVGEGAVAVLDTGTAEGGEAFFVMDLLDGETVEARRLRSGGRLDAIDVLAIADRVLDVLATAHERNIVHRDVKPENLFVTTKGEVKVLDFGLARCRELSTASHETTTGAWLGTPPFMAPEHARGTGPTSMRAPISGPSAQPCSRCSPAGMCTMRRPWRACSRLRRHVRRGPSTR